MAEAKDEVRLEKAIEEFQQYLSDILPPLVVTDSLQFLFQQPPDLIAANIYSWVNGQMRTARSISMADYFFHALKKIHLMGEYHLINREELLDFLERLKPLILNSCPPGDRDFLQQNLQHMDEVPSSLSSAVEVLYRQGSAQPAASVSRGTEGSLGEGDIQRLTLLMTRIEKELRTLAATGGDAESDQRQRELISEALAQAARSARASVELERALEQLRRMGVSAGTEDVFRALGRELPEWSLAPRPGYALPEDSNLKAMHRIVTQANDAREGGTRFHQMVRAAVERFNEGHLAQSVSMLELAEKIITSKEVDTAVSDNIRRRGHEDLDFEKLRKYADAPENFPVLRKVLNFFEGFSPAGLLETLRNETRRERRRLYLALLEVHGEATRGSALDALRPPLSSSAGNDEIYFRRNLLYLLKRIPVPSSENMDDVVSIVGHHVSLNTPMVILKEAVAYLGQLKNPGAESTLITFLEDIEEVLLSANDSPLDVQELHLLLDRVAAALGRMGTPAAHEALVEHAFKKKPKLGDTIGRLAELSGQDLSSDTAVMERLLQGLKNSFPRKLLGFTMQVHDHEMESIVKAISATTTPAARNALQEVAERFRNRPAGQLAARMNPARQEAAFAKREPEPSPSSLTGDLDFFSLPALLQSLSDNQVTGVLSLKSRDGSAFGTIRLEYGNFAGSEAGTLTGESAIFQLLERPESGTFQFVRSERPKARGETQEILPLILEGIRRYDELREAEALLPGQAHLIAKTNQPVQLTDEKDGLLFRELWNLLKNGATPLQCESEVKADAYRVRRLLVHWLEAGSIAPL